MHNTIAGDSRKLNAIQKYLEHSGYDVMEATGANFAQFVAWDDDFLVFIHCFEGDFTMESLPLYIRSYIEKEIMYTLQNADYIKSGDFPVRIDTIEICCMAMGDRAMLKHTRNA